MDIPALARQLGVPVEAAAQRDAEVKRRLLEARRQRPTVPVDDKIVTVWNGYLIGTLALAGQLLDEPRYTAAAAAAAGFILDRLYDDGTGVLYRDWRQGVRGVPGFCEDYAALAAGLLDLYEASGAPRWLATARRLGDVMLERYQDADHGGFYRTAADSGLWLREKEVSDGASLSVNGVAIEALLALGRLTRDERYTHAARRAAAWAATQLADAPEAMPSILVNWRELLHINRTRRRTGTSVINRFRRRNSRQTGGTDRRVGVEDVLSDTSDMADTAKLNGGPLSHLMPASIAWGGPEKTVGISSVRLGRDGCGISLLRWRCDPHRGYDNVRVRPNTVVQGLGLHVVFGPFSPSFSSPPPLER